MSAKNNEATDATLKSNLIVKKKNEYQMTPTEISEELKIPRTTIISICKKWVETGETGVSPQKGQPTVWTDEMKQFIDNEVIQSNGTITLKQLKEELEETFADKKAPILSAICDYLDYGTRLLLKRVSSVEDPINEPTAIKQRKEYCKSLLIEGTDYDKNCIFINEAGFNVNLLRGRARAKPNKPAVVHLE